MFAKKFHLDNFGKFFIFAKTFFEEVWKKFIGQLIFTIAIGPMVNKFLFAMTSMRESVH